MILIGEIILLLINVVMAIYHASLFNENKFVKHGWWAALYIGIAALFSYLSKNWGLFLAALLIRKLFFDTTLNISRRPPLRLFYISPEVKSRKSFWIALWKGEVIDWIHWKLFGNHPEIYFILYFLSLIALNIFLM